MIFIIHGEDFVKSRQQIIELKQKIESKLKNTQPFIKHDIDITETSPQKIKEYGSMFDMFSGAPFIVLDISKNKARKVDDYIDAIKSLPNDTNLIIFSNKDLSKSNAFIKASSKIKAKVIHNKIQINSNIFNFVDALFLKNRKSAYNQLQILLKDGNDPFYIFSMILYGLRTLASVKLETKDSKKMNVYARNKALKQAKQFSHEQLVNLYNEIYKIDKKIKTGELPVDLMIPLTIEKVLI